MPTYDLSLVVKHAIKRPEIISAVKRIGENIIENGGYIRNLEFVGNRALPQKAVANSESHIRGNFFVLRIDLPVSQIPKLNDLAKRNSHIIKNDLVSVSKREDPVCTLDEEFLSPSKRPSIQAMIDIGRSRPKLTKVYKKNTGLEFEPLFR